MKSDTPSTQSEKSTTAVGGEPRAPGKAKRALSGVSAALVVFFSGFVTAFLMGANNPASARPEAADKLAIAVWLALLPLIVAGLIAGLRSRKRPFVTALGVCLLTFVVICLLTNFIYPSLP